MRAAPPTPIPVCKKPTFNRLLLAILGWLLALPVAAQKSLTEEQAVQRALGRAALQELLEAEVAVEQGRQQAQSAYPNPQLSYLREQTFGALGTGEDYLSIAQPIDLGNRRGLAADAGRSRVQAANAEGRAARVAIVATVRQRFFELLFRQERSAALQQWTDRIDEALAIVTRRELRGDAATYDRRRLERERAVATSRSEMELASLSRARALLQALLEPGARPPVAAGELLPAADPLELPALHSTVAARADLRALTLRADAASWERRAAGRWWLPDMRLEAGWKGVHLNGQSGQTRTDGFLLGASLPLPLWDRASGLARIAQAEERAARARRSLLENELLGQIAGAREEAVHLRRAGNEFAERAIATSTDLVRIASAGYEGGELGLLELLDAFRGAADDALAALDMAHAARKARIDLDQLTGTAP
jgi:outer membrane protein, heavy metal efflux system